MPASGATHVVISATDEKGQSAQKTLDLAADKSAGVVLLLLVVWGERRRSVAARTDRWLVAAAVVYGVALGNQALMLLAAPGIALYVLATEPRILRRPVFVLGCAAAVLGAAALMYLQLPLAVALDRPLIYARPGTWDGFWYIVLGEQFRGSLGDPIARPVETLRAMAGVATALLVLQQLRRPAYTASEPAPGVPAGS